MDSRVNRLPDHLRRRHPPSGRAVVEIHQLWRSWAVDTRHFAPGDAVHIGSQLRDRWFFLGVDMGQLPRTLARLLTLMLPLVSEQRTEAREAFYADSDLLPGARHLLVEPTQTGWLVHPPAGWQVYARLAHRPARLAEGPVPLSPDLELVLARGDHALAVQLVAPAQRVERAGPQLESPFLGWMSVFACAALVFIGVVSISPPRPVSSMIEVPDYFVEKLLVPPPPQAQRRAAPPAPAESGRTAAEAASVHDTAPTRSPLDRRRRDRRVVEQAGVIGALARLGEVGGVFEGSELDPQLTNSLDGLSGPARVALGGGPSWGRGDNPFGGRAEGIGSDLGTQGVGSGDPDYGGIEPMHKPTGAPPEPEAPTLVGHYPREQVQTVIRSHLEQFRYCYQRRLQRDASLGGKVVVKFIITQDGSVTGATVKNTTVADPEVGDCLVARFSKLSFPRPERGVVIVSYPFVFVPPT